MRIIDGDGGGSAIPMPIDQLDPLEKSRVFGFANPVVLGSLPLGSSPDAHRDPAAFKNELLLAWTLACSAQRDDFDGSCDWGYILPDGSIQRQSFRIDNSSLQLESTTSEALSGIRGHEVLSETKGSHGSKLFFGHRPDLLRAETFSTLTGDEDVSGFPPEQ